MKSHLDNVQGSFRGLSDVKLVRKTANETVNNSAVLQNDNELLFSAEANKVYLFEIYILQNSPSAADLKIGWSLPAGASMNWNSEYYRDEGGNHQYNVGATEASSINTQGFAAKVITHIAGIIANGATAGTCNFQWAQVAATVGDTIVYANSLLIVVKVN